MQNSGDKRRRRRQGICTLGHKNRAVAGQIRNRAGLGLSLLQDIS